MHLSLSDTVALVCSRARIATTDFAPSKPVPRKASDYLNFVAQYTQRIHWRESRPARRPEGIPTRQIFPRSSIYAHALLDIAGICAFRDFDSSRGTKYANHYDDQPPAGWNPESVLLRIHGGYGRHVSLHVVGYGWVFADRA